MKRSPIIRSILSDIFAIAVAFGISAILLYMVDVNPLSAFHSLFLGAFGSVNQISL